MLCFNLRHVLKLIEQFGCRNICATKNIISLYSFSLNQVKVNSLKHVLESYDICNKSSA